MYIYSVQHDIHMERSTSQCLSSSKERTLQSEMHFDDDLITFAKLMWLIRHVAARHIDLSLSYNLQDPATLTKIKEEITSKSSILLNDYVDAWPITYYLKMALKRHRPTRGSSATGSTRSRRTMLVTHGHFLQSGSPRPSRRGICFSPRTSIPPSRSDSVCHRAVTNGGKTFQLSTYLKICRKRRDAKSSQGQKTRRQVGANHSGSSDSTGVEGVERGRIHVSERSSLDTVQSNWAPSPGTSVHNTTCQTQACVQSGSTHCVARTGQGRSAEYMTRPAFLTNVNEVAVSDVVADDIVEVLPHSSNPSHPSPASVVSPSASQEIMTPQSAAPNAPADMPRAAVADSAPSSEILRKLLGYGLPYADAERIVRLLASLGIKNLQFLRVLSNMISCNDWLQELKTAGQLNELELRLIREILDGLKQLGDGGLQEKGMRGQQGS
ncbi:hypothetical protein BD414DRAFT_478017 [Trametes punicea]|nr:hypothetical protein BD414DRAFT_478017 [Trametes punicea]